MVRPVETMKAIEKSPYLPILHIVVPPIRGAFSSEGMSSCLSTLVGEVACFYFEVEAAIGYG
jgi:hypothetical protein